MSDVTIDPNAADIDLEPDFTETVQVKDVEVVFLPKKDFEARINDRTWHFSSETPQRIPRTLAKVLLEDPSHGYIKD